MNMIDPLDTSIIVPTPVILDREHARQRREWGLTRMIFIDSYSEGRVVEFDVAGGSALAGRNGEGKTALLSILPLFHGEQPNRLVKKEENRQSLVAHYLGRQTSYIVFEYAQQSGQMRMSVMSASSSNDAVEVMLVRSAYHEDLFKRDDGSWVNRAALRAALTSKGLTVNGWYDLPQYRRILHRIRSGRENAGLAELYSVAPPGASLDGIEKIVSGMFKRATKFDEIANIVVREVMTDQSDSMSLGLDRDAVDKWRGDYAAYLDVERHREQHGVLLRKSMEREAARAEAKEAKTRLNAFVTHARLQSIEIASELTLISRTRTILEEDREVLSEKKADLGTVRRTISDRRSQSETFLVQKDEYERSGIIEAADALRRIPDMDQEIDALTDSIEVLEGDASELNAKYAVMASKQKTIAADRIREIQQDAQERLAPLMDALREGQEQLDRAIEMHDRAAEMAEREHEAIVEQATGEWASAKARSEHPAASGQVRDELKEAVRQREIAVENERVSKKSHDDAEREAGRIRERIAFMDQDIAASERRLVNLREKVRIAGEKVEGPAGSILRWARDNMPHSVDDVTKVLTDSILLRNDLQPSKAADGRHSIFGIRIDTSRIATSAAGHRESAAEELRSVQAEESAAVADLKHKENDLTQANAQLKVADRAYRTAVTNHAVAISKAKNSIAAEKSKKEAVLHDELRAKREAERVLEEAETRFREAKRAKSTARQTMTETRNALRATWSRERDRLNGDIDRITRQRDHDVTASEARRDAILSGIDGERDIELKSRNVDVDALKAMRSRLDRMVADRAAVARRAGEVARWEVWSGSEPEKHRIREQEIDALVRDETDRTTFIQAEEIRIKAISEESDRKEKDAKARKARFDGDAQRVEQQLNNTGDLQIGTVDAWRPEEDLGSTQARAVEAGKTIDALTKEIDRGTRTLQDVFGRHQATSLGGGLTRDAGADDHDELAPYTEWYDEGHLAMRNQINIQVMNIIRIVGVFHAGLRNFGQKVRGFNRQIQDSLNQTGVFESLTGLEITISTTYDQMKWWRILEASNDKGIEVRSRIEANDLPDPSYADVLEELMATWKEGSGINAELRRIVDIRGHVMDKGQKKTFSRDTDLTKLSSNGLSYLILASILTAFVDRIRGGSKGTTIIWAIDELRDLDGVNVTALVRMLASRNIEIVSAFTAADSTYMKHFANRYSMMPGRRIQRAILRDRDAERIERRAAMESAHA